MSKWMISDFKTDNGEAVIVEKLGFRDVEELPQRIVISLSGVVNEATLRKNRCTVKDSKRDLIAEKICEFLNNNDF